LKKGSAPFPFSLTGGPYFEGRLLAGGVDKGSVRLAWVSPFFRRASVEIDTLAGAAPPAPVPDGAGGTEFLDTIFAKIGWQLGVVSDQANVPVPAGIVATNCWTPADLHNLMTTVRDPTTDLDKEWRMHLIVVPAKLGCGRGVMYDQIGVPREACASFSDDGYPTDDSTNFGVAANQQQRNVPRAYLRSAAHEITHTLNQIHQEQETMADNSIMTTTPSVADTLGSATTGAPGVFPTEINLGFNEHVRHHLVHFPDPTVRPGGMTFGSGHSSTVPEADRYFFEPGELELVLTLKEDHIELGEPLALSWVVRNVSGVSLPVPTDVGVEAQHATITVTDPRGHRRLVPSFIIRTDHVSIGPLDNGEELASETRVFWSSLGFAFPEPGKYQVEVRIAWAYGEAPLGVRASAEVFVNYPQAVADNQAAAALLHPEVGMYVALGGDAPHLTTAIERIQDVVALGGAGDQAGAKVLRGYADLIPSKAEIKAAADRAARDRAAGDRAAGPGKRARGRAAGPRKRGR
jgi:hypothetical protein